MTQRYGSIRKLVSGIGVVSGELMKKCEYDGCGKPLIGQRKNKRFCNPNCKRWWYSGTEHGKVMLAKHAYNRKLRDAGVVVMEEGEEVT